VKLVRLALAKLLSDDAINGPRNPTTKRPSLIGKAAPHRVLRLSACLVRICSGEKTFSPSSVRRRRISPSSFSLAHPGSPKTTPDTSVWPSPDMLPPLRRPFRARVPSAGRVERGREQSVGYSKACIRVSPSVPKDCIPCLLHYRPPPHQTGRADLPASGFRQRSSA
jgi:hypothetical protein